MQKLACSLVLLGSTTTAWGFNDSNCKALKLSYGDCYNDSDEKIINAQPQARTDQDIRNFLDPGANANIRATHIALAGGDTDTLIWKGVILGRAKLFDKQEGNAPNAGGTTSAVSRGIVPSILSFAVENGSIAQTNRGTATTFRGNLLGVANLVAGKSQFPYCPIQSNCSTGAKFLDSVSFHVAFDPQRDASSGVSPVFTGSTRQIGAWGVRWDWRTRNRVIDPKWTQDTNALEVTNFAKSYALKLAEVLAALTPADFKKILDAYVPLFQLPTNASPTRIKVLTTNFLSEIIEALNKDGDIQKKVQDSLLAQGSYIGARDYVLKKYVKGWNTAVELDSIRPVQQPEYWTSRAVLALTFDKDRPLTWTSNAAASWYDEKQAIGVRKLRDLQLATELSKKIVRPDAFSIGISAAYYMQWMAQDSLLSFPTGITTLPNTSIPVNSQTVKLLGTKGAIHVGQIRLTLSHPSWPFTIPLALNAANRSELIPASNVKYSANIGLSVDFDKLLGVVK